MSRLPSDEMRARTKSFLRVEGHGSSRYRARKSIRRELPSAASLRRLGPLEFSPITFEWPRPTTY